MTSFFSRRLASSPDWCTVYRYWTRKHRRERVVHVLPRTISHPPTNSPPTYNWGIVGHSENSLIPLLSSGSSSTSYVFIFSGGTPCKSSTCTVARENPHCGTAGVPFMKRTTGEASTAFWIVLRVAWDNKRVNVCIWMGVSLRLRRGSCGEVRSVVGCLR